MSARLEYDRRLRVVSGVERLLFGRSDGARRERLSPLNSPGDKDWGSETHSPSATFLQVISAIVCVEALLCDDLLLEPQNVERDDRLEQAFERQLADRLDFDQIFY